MSLSTRSDIKIEYDRTTPQKEWHQAKTSQTPVNLGPLCELANRKFFSVFFSSNFRSPPMFCTFAVPSFRSPGIARRPSTGSPDATRRGGGISDPLHQQVLRVDPLLGPVFVSGVGRDRADENMERRRRGAFYGRSVFHGWLAEVGSKIFPQTV